MRNGARRLSLISSCLAATGSWLSFRARSPSRIRNALGTSCSTSSQRLRDERAQCLADTDVAAAARVEGTTLRSAPVEAEIAAHAAGATTSARSLSSPSNRPPTNTGRVIVRERAQHSDEQPDVIAGSSSCPFAAALRRASQRVNGEPGQLDTPCSERSGWRGSDATFRWVLQFVELLSSRRPPCVFLRNRCSSPAAFPSSASQRPTSSSVNGSSPRFRLRHERALPLSRVSSSVASSSVSREGDEARRPASSGLLKRCCFA